MFVPVVAVFFSPLSASAKQLTPKSAGGDVLHHLGSKVESYVYRSLKCQMNYEVAPVVRPTPMTRALTHFPRLCV